MVIPTLTDPSLAPPGKHVLSCFVQYAPYHLKEGAWDDKREAFGDAVVDTIAEHAPNIRKNIIGRQVLTPLDIERKVGLSRGQHFSGRTFPRAAFLSAARGRLGALPHADSRLYLCGSATHPGGGIMGAPGRLAALEILKDTGGE